METTKNTQATAQDAELVLRLYDLRREPEMRKARNYYAAEFLPKDFAEAEQIIGQFGSEHSRWVMQVVTYWETAAALVVRGALHPGLFYDTCGEGYFVYAKEKRFIQQVRAKYNPEHLVNLEKVVEGTAEGRERLRSIEQMIARMNEARAQQKQSQAA